MEKGKIIILQKMIPHKLENQLKNCYSERIHKVAGYII